MNKILSIILLVLFAASMEAKSSPENEFIEHRVVAIFDKFSYQLDENTSWSISSTSDNTTLKSGMGSINDITFPAPGIYTVEITEISNHNECSHGRYPKKIEIQVSAMKMEFDFSTIKFNSEIIGGQSQDGNTLSVDVVFSSIANESVELKSTEITTAGVGVNIKGNLVNEKITLTPGVNHLVYKLTGQATSQTFIMFDFIDVNGNVISYYHPTKIK